MFAPSSATSGPLVESYTLWQPTHLLESLPVPFATLSSKPTHYGKPISYRDNTLCNGKEFEIVRPLKHGSQHKPLRMGAIRSGKLMTEKRL